MIRQQLGKRTVSLLLAVVIMIGIVPFNVISTGAAVTPTPGTRITDLSTLNNWKTIFGSATNFNTANAGHVWTDKSVLTSAAEFAYANELSDGVSKLTLSGNENNFLVALSAISSSKSITGEANKPTDTMIVLDLSSSMYRGSAKETGAINSMIDAVNETIANLQKLNVHNRVGVVIYYGGPDLNQATAPSYQSWLALDRYSHSSNKFLTYTTSSGKLSKVGVNTNVTNSAGAKVTATQRTVPDVSGTYVQQGLLAALETFKKADITVPATAATQAGVKRTPVIILMSDGQPTAATNSYTSISSNAVMGSNREDIRSAAETDFLTQLTASYTKESVAAHYGETPLFYTLSLGNTISYDVMDPLNTLKLNSGTYTSKISGYWDQLIALTNTTSAITITAKVSRGQWNANTKDVNFDVKKTNVNGALFPASKAQQNYVNKAFVANTASDLKNVFNNIFTNISLQTHTYSTLVSGDADLGGYVSFVDKIGEYMTVTDVKGILIGNVWYSGKELSKNFVPGGGSLGSISAPSELGHELIHAVQQRLGIADVLVARSLIQNAFNYGQLSYDSATGAFNNYVGWYADANGNFLGFWHEGSTTQPAGAVYHMKSFLYLGTADASHGVRDSDLMYATVQHRTHIATGEETMTFAVPAALLPTVTYDIELNASGNPTAVKMGGATNPIRLVYEVALSDNINELTLLDPTVVDPAYVAANTNPDGSVNFYTNMYEVDNTVGYGKVNTYSYFRPAHSNENYYFLKNETVYTNTTGTKYVSTSAPSAGGTYYRASTVYKSVNGAISAETAYIPLSPEALATAKHNTGDNTWYIPAGNVHADLARYTTVKPANATGTLPNVETPFVDLHGHNVNDASHTFVIGYTLGNNGRVSIMPTTGIRITKSIDEVNAEAGANKIFDFTVTNKTNPTDSSTYKTYRVDASNKVTEATVTFTAGKASIALSAGESFYIIGLKAGDVINVTETETEYYKLSSINGIANVPGVDVTLVNQQISSAAFVNTARGKGNLTVAKEVLHSLGSEYEIPADKVFNVTVTLSGLALEGKIFEAKHSGDTTVASVTIDAANSFSFTIRHDEQFEVYGLPEGITATVKETNVPAGFIAAYNDNGTAGDGIVTITKGNTEFVEVLNTYKPDPVTVGTQIVVSGDKIFLNEDGSVVADWEGKTFSATLQKYDGTKWVDLETVNATAANKKFTFNFAGETYAEAGIYSYQVIEVIPDDKDGILYDRTIHTFSVTVGDSNMDGKLEILKVTSEHTGTDFTPVDGVWTVPSAFTNKKETSLPAVLEIKLQKALNNASESPIVSLSGYSFGLYTDAACTTALTAGNGIQKINAAFTDNVGESSIDLIFDKAGNYSFYIKEIAGSIPSMKYSDQVVEVIVNVTSKEGRLYAEATYDANALIKDGELVFTNDYIPKEASLVLDVRKLLSGRELKADEFSFTLKSEDGSYTETVKNKADGDVPFSALKFTKVGSYVYYVNEVIPLDQNKLGGVTYDTKVHKIIVTVKDEGGALTAAYIIEDIAENYVIFTNEYKTKPVEYTVEGTKVLEGRTLLNDEFGFTLTACDENGAPILGAAVLKARNFADGSFKFDKLTFNTAGTYYYLASEVQENTAHGVKYDTTEYIIRIVVKDNLKGALEIDSVDTIVKLARVNSASGIVFTNVYTPAPASGQFGGNKVYTTSISGTVEQLDLSKNTFTFNLYHSNESWAVGERIQSVHNDASGSFTFDKINYDKVGTYYYIITEQNGGQTLNGIVYDPTVYRVKVTVTDNGKGALSANVLIANANDIPQDSISFSNEYVITNNTEAVFSGRKFLHGLTLKEGQFSFILIDTTSDKSNTAPLQTVKNAADGTFSFSPIVYTKPGTYTYSIKEANGGDTIDGIKYDTTVYEITVTVTDNGSGKLSAAVIGVESITFTNTYKADPAKASFGGTKALTGRDLKAGEFSFVLLDKNGEIVEAVKNAADGSFSFSEITYTAAGTYTYTVAEQSGTLGGVTYDNTKYTVTVTVTDDGKGKLTATVSGADAIKFTNTYKTDSTTASFGGTKVLHGKKLEAGNYEFVLKDEGGNVIETVKNAADGSFAFAKLTYTKAGTYKYTVSEVAGSLGGVTYDSTVYNITVEVKDDGAGKLIATVSGAEGIIFNNNYTPASTSVSLGGNKTYTTTVGGTTQDLDLSANTFTFNLYHSDSSWAQGEHIQGVHNGADGKFSFDKLSFNKVGEYYYIVKEHNGGKTVNGTVYDSAVYRVKIVVTDDGNGKLNATLSLYNASGNSVSAIAFANTYVITDNAEALFGGTKVLHGKKLEAGQYEFVLKDEGGNVIETVNNAADGSFAFAKLTYTKAGTYKYTVSEKAGSLGGVTYDSTVYNITVEVKDDGAGKLIATVSGAQGITFINNYNTDPTTASFGGTKTLTGRELKAGEFSFVLLDKNGEIVETVKNAADGTFSFSALTYTAAGTYTYTVAEQSGTLGGVTYDNTKYTVTVTVTDDGKGKLTATVSGADAIKFTNTYKTDSITASFGGTKVLHGKKLEAGQYEFVLKDEGGNVIETVKNAADGSFAFAKLTYTKAGTYKYTVSEVAGSLGGVTYDSTVYNITVEVKDDGAGKLIATVSGAEGIIFNNYYNVSTVSTKLNGIKKFYTVIDGVNQDLDLSKTVFTFSLYHSDASWKLGEHIQSVENDAAGAFSFSELKFSKAGTYYYVVEERNGGKTVNGIAHDATVYRVTVTVTDNGDGTLTATTAIADASGAGKTQIVFTNVYAVSETEALFSGSKILHGKKLEAGKYEFVLKDEGGNVIETVKNAADGSFSFTAIKYAKAGTYKYTVSEKSGSLGGVTYDSTVYNITVEVKDDGAGKLVAFVSGAEGITFINNYKADSVKASFGGTKTLAGRDLKAGEFSFVLIDKNGEVVETVKNAANGTFSFSEITYTAAGTYTYTVAEVTGFAGGVTYDNTKYTVTVTVTDDSNGKLSAKVSGAENIKFSNTYSASETEVSFSGNKVLVGRNLENGEFSFILKDEKGNEIETVKNHSDGTFSFAKLTYTKAGTYKYTVSEVKSDIPGITYDSTVYSITVEVKDNGSGKLVAAVTGAESISFKNVYNASSAEVHLSGLKTLIGRSLKAGEFSFVLKDASGKEIEVVHNKANGSFEFSALKFAAAGTYTYTVSEVAGSLGGVTYANNSYTVTVTVVDDTTLGKLVASVSDNANAIVFTNTYEAKSTFAAISGKKNLIGRKLSAGEFSFVLKDEGGNVIETVKNAADGSFAFSKLTYTKAGTYVYTVSEVAGSLGGITYDGTVHTVTVTVTDNGVGQLIAAVSSTEAVVFNNVYQARPGSVKFNGTKIFEGAALAAGEFTFTLTETTAGSVVLETVQNTANGSFSFSEIVYTKTGVYTYEIRETAGDRPNVDYDSTVYAITVTVTDNGDGTLKVQVSNNANAIVFKNRYNTYPALLPVSGIKNIDGRAIKANEFSFVIKDSDGRELERVMNDANGKWSFSDLKLAEVGTYTFTVSEVKGSLGGVTYDETVYEITATVTDSGDGKLTASASVNKISGKTATAVTLADLVFNNKYETTDTNAAIKGQKSLYGRDLISDEFLFVLSDVNGNRIESVSNDVYGNFEFSPIKYTAPGVYTYYVSEYNTGDSSIVYDDTVYTVTVIVSDNGQGSLTATVSSNENIHFVNRYSARPAEVRFSATKYLEGRDLTKGEFSFILSDANGNVIQTVKNKEDGSIDFAWLVFPQHGTFVYRIREIIGNDENVIYDETVYEITVVIYDDMAGDLIAEVIGGDNLIFTNVYEAPEETTEIPEDTTKIPEDTTKVPEDTTKVPEDTTKVPEDTTKVPEDTTKAPEDTTKVPEDTTKVPEDTTKVPEDTTKVPEDTTDPSETTDPDSPTTGDSSKVTVWLGAIFVSFCATAGALFSKKRATEE